QLPPSPLLPYPPLFRSSFDVAMRQLGGQSLALNQADLQVGRGEPISDTAKVVSRYVDVIMIRANKHETLTEYAANATVPVINGLDRKSTRLNSSHQIIS